MPSPSPPIAPEHLLNFITEVLQSVFASRGAEGPPNTPEIVSSALNRFLGYNIDIQSLKHLSTTQNGNNDK